jgi:hypothetical protein
VFKKPGLSRYEVVSRNSQVHDGLLVRVFLENEQTDNITGQGKSRVTKKEIIFMFGVAEKKRTRKSCFGRAPVKTATSNGREETIT